MSVYIETSNLCSQLLYNEKPTICRKLVYVDVRNLCRQIGWNDKNTCCHLWYIAMRRQFGHVW